MERGPEDGVRTRPVNAASLVLYPPGMAIYYGAIPAFYTENFPTRYRASGASAAYQISQVYGGDLIPIMAGLILKSVGIKHAFIYIGLLVMVYALAAIWAILATPDTKGIDIA